MVNNGWISVTSGTTDVVSGNVYYRYAEGSFDTNISQQPKKETPEQWLRNRVKEICDLGNLN